MRILLASTLFTAACTAGSPAGGPTYDSVRDRLADGPTRLYVGTDASTGTITARRYTPSGWQEGSANVAIDGGELFVEIDAAGKLAMNELTVSLAPIEIPDEVFGKPAQLDDVRFSLAKPATADAQWAGDDDATATFTVDIDFDWAIAINGGKTQLATQHVSPVTAAVALTGAGDHVDASLSLRASGKLWNWAGLLEMTEVELALSAATPD
jgi:hypothetical protein